MEESPISRSRKGVESDFAELTSGFGRESRLVTPEDRLPVQMDRQLDILVTPPAGGGGSFTYPFQITDATVTLGTPLIAVNFGTMQDMVPTGMSGSLSVALGTNYVYLDVTVDINGNVTAVALAINTTGQPANTSTDGYITLGQVVVSTVGPNSVITAINQAATHSLRCGICGRVVTGGILIQDGFYEFWGF